MAPLPTPYLLFTPDQLLVIVSLLSGFLFGESFRILDYQLKQSPMFHIMSPMQRFLFGWFPDLLHHFQYGLALMWFSYQTESITLGSFAYYFGLGMVLADVKNYKAVLRRISNAFTQLNVK